MGDIPTRRHDSLLTRTLLKWLVVYAPIQPPPGKVQTAPEMLTTAPAQWDQDLRACEILIQRLVSTPTNATHPFFGPLTHAAWGRLGWRHLDHHLRQFGL